MRGLRHLLLVGELVDKLHLLHEVPGNISGNLTEVVLTELIADPETDVLVAWRKLGIGLELSSKVA
jgi:hypothetical protein